MNKLVYILIIFIITGCTTYLTVKNNNILNQQYIISHKSLIYKDKSRNGRSITAELFYPSYLNDNKIADGNFSLIIFAHGYQQRFTNYQYLYKRLIPKGYILAFLTTEQGLIIDIDNYAQDIVFLQNKLLNSKTILSNHLKPTSALMGHSTGGGAIYLAQNISHRSTTIISMAALGKVYFPIYGTNPIDIAQNIMIPSLLLSGSQDCITPLKSYQKPLYENLHGKKEILIIKGGDHCGFSNSLDCPLAESFMCGLFFQGKTIDENLQKDITLNKIVEWLDKYL